MDIRRRELHSQGRFYPCCTLPCTTESCGWRADRGRGAESLHCPPEPVHRRPAGLLPTGANAAAGLPGRELRGLRHRRRPLFSAEHPAAHDRVSEPGQGTGGADHHLYGILLCFLQHHSHSHAAHCGRLSDGLPAGRHPHRDRQRNRPHLRRQRRRAGRAGTHHEQAGQRFYGG